MPIWLDVNIAITPHVAKVPIVDKATGIVPSTGIAYNKAGMDVRWNFVTTLGVGSSTAVVPTTAGVHDWVELGDGLYTLAMPATTGTVNNDAEGFGWWSGSTTDDAVFTSPVYGFRAAALNNALIDGGDELDVNVTKVADTAQTAADIGQLSLDNNKGIILGACGSTNLTNTTCSSDLTGYTVDQLVGRVIIFLDGDADGEATRISGYVVTNGVLTFDALSGAIAPANLDNFKIV